MDTLYDDFSPYWFRKRTSERFDDGKFDYYFARIGEKYPQAKLFDDVGEPEWMEPIQGMLSTCYFISSLSSVGEQPDVIKNAFLTKERNEAGIYAIRFYVRGKPWVVTVDDEMLF
jgi:hypothetical protein